MPYITSIERLGREEGREEGREVGRKEGRKEERQDVARRMLARGTDRAFILEVTELTEQELGVLEKELETRQEQESP